MLYGWPLTVAGYASLVFSLWFVAPVLIWWNQTFLEGSFYILTNLHRFDYADLWAQFLTIIGTIGFGLALLFFLGGSASSDCRCHRKCGSGCSMFYGYADHDDYLD